MCTPNQLYADVRTGDVYRLVCIAHGNVQCMGNIYVLQGRKDAKFGFGLERGVFYVTEEEIEDNYIILNNMFYEGD